jgi:hypothetical protein
MDNDIMKAYPSKEIAMAYLKKEPKRNKWISLRFNLRFKKNPGKEEQPGACKCRVGSGL